MAKALNLKNTTYRSVVNIDLIKSMSKYMLDCMDKDTIIDYVKSYPGEDDFNIFQWVTSTYTTLIYIEHYTT